MSLSSESFTPILSFRMKQWVCVLMSSLFFHPLPPQGLHSSILSSIFSSVCVCVLVRLLLFHPICTNVWLCVCVFAGESSTFPSSPPYIKWCVEYSSLIPYTCSYATIDASHQRALNFIIIGYPLTCASCWVISKCVGN